MASRNERKRRAKARHAELQGAVAAAFAKEHERKREVDSAKASYIARTQDALRWHRDPRQRLGKIQDGKFVSAPCAPEPPKRKLVENPFTGKLIERKSGKVLAMKSRPRG